VSVVANVAINVDSRNAVTQLQRFENATKSAAAGVAGLVASLGAGLAFAQLIKSASQFEAELSEIGKTAGASEKEIANLAVALKGLSAPSKTNLAPSILAAGVKDLVAQGLKLNDAVASMETLGKVAVATNSELTDVTKTGFQLQSALKIKPTELKATFDALAFAGKAGAFELKDMAQFMPTIASAATSLGIKGKDGAVALAAMMQMVRKDAPGAAEASTRLTDALLKMTAPDAVKNFTKFGVDIETVLKKAVKDGINPMDAAIEELIRVTGKDPFKLSQIFGDKEAKLALMSLMKYKEEYEKLKAAAGGTAAAGTVQADFEKSLKTFNGQLQTLQTSGELVALSLGSKLLPILARLIEEILPVVNGVASFVEGMGQVPKPVIDAAIGIGKVIIQLMLVDKALKIAMATAALFRGAMLLLTTQTTLAGAAALTGQARLLMLAGGIKGAGVAAAASAATVNLLKVALLGLLRFGLITLAIEIVVSGLGKLAEVQARMNAITKGSTKQFAEQVGGSATSRQEIENLKKQNREERARRVQEQKDVRFPLFTAQDDIARQAITQLDTRFAQLQTMGERARFATPAARAVSDANALNTPIGATVGGTTATGPTGGKPKAASDEAANAAKRIAEQIRASQVQLTLAQDIFAIEGRLQEAQLAGNDQLVLARNAQKELAQIASQRADIVANKEMPALEKKNVLDKLAIDAATVSGKLGFDLAKIEQDRTKSFDEIIAGLESELKLKQATTEEAREQLRLENELRKLEGQGFTDEQVGQITGLQAQIAAPDTAAQTIEKRIGALKDEITDLTNIGNIAIAVADGIGAAFGQAFQGLISGSMSAKEALSGFFKSVADMFLEMAAQIIAKQITMIILQTILKALGGAPGGGSSSNAAGFGGSFDAGIPAIGNTTDFSGAFKMRAMGGPVSSQQPYIVGERGPELFVPGSNGGVMSNNDLRSAMGSRPSSNGSPVLNMSFQSTTINGVEYVSRDQLEAAMAQTRRDASNDGAKRGMSMTLDKLQQSPSTRRKVGI
jgi:TP901 family phage tail tape measure protein